MAKFLDLEGLNYFWEKIKSWVQERFAYKSDLNQKQDKLRSGQNIKTINNQDILGSGNIEIESGAVDSVNGKTGDVVLDAEDVGALPNSTTIPTKISDLNNDSSFTSVSIDRKVSTGTNIADITIDGTTTQLYAPTGGGGGGEDNIIESISVNGTAQTITNKNVDITVPTTLASLSDDATHRVVTDTDITTWNGKSNFSGSYDDLTDKPTLFSGNYNDLSNKPTIPTVPTDVSAFNNDAGYLTSQDITGKADKVSNPTSGNFAGLDSNGNLTDSGSKASDFVTSTRAIPSGGNAGQVLKKVSATDYDVTWANQSETLPSAYCTTSGGTAAKKANCSLYVTQANQYLQVLIGSANTYQGALTLNINSAGAKPIYINGTVSSSSNYTLSNGTYFVFYDGTNYYFRTDGKIQGPDGILYNKPSTGIPASDLASGVIPDVSGKEDTSNKVTSFQSTPDDTHYPSEKLVKDSLDTKIDNTDVEALTAIDVDNTPTANSSNLVTSGGVYNALINKQDKMPISSASGTTLSAVANTYHNFTSEVNTLAIILPAVTDVTHITNIVFMLTTGTTPAITFAASDTGVNVIAQDGFSIEASTTYEINAIFNGTMWVVAAMKLSTTPINS